MRRLFILPVLALAACEEPQAPSPALARLQAACEAGDTGACAQVVSFEQRQQALRQQAYQAWVGSQVSTYQDPADFMVQTNSPRTTTCAPIYGTRTVNCTTY